MGRAGRSARTSEQRPFLHLVQMDADGNYTSFNLGQESEGSSMCVGALAGVDLGLGKNVWLLGDRYVGYRRMSEGALLICVLPVL